MNPNIKKVYEAAIGKDWAYDFDPDIAEKFAKMMVRECIIELKELYDLDFGLSESIERLEKTYFGVE